MLVPRLRSEWNERRGGRVAEGGGLLNRYRMSSPIVGSNPIPSAIYLRSLAKLPILPRQAARLLAAASAAAAA